MVIASKSALTQAARQGLSARIMFARANMIMNIVIPAKRNRKQQREYDRYLYRLRHLVENAFLHLKRWRGIATRYAKLQHLFWLLCKFVALLFGVLF